MTNFRRGFKHIMKKKLMNYRKKLSSLNTLIKIAIKLNNQFYKLTIEI